MRRAAASLANRLPAGLRRSLKRLPGTASLKDSLAGRPQRPDAVPGELRPVVYLPTWARWNEMRQRPQYVTEAFADLGHAAYFVDPRETAVGTEGVVTIVPSLEETPSGGVILYTHFAPLVTLVDRYDDAVVVYDILDDLSIYDADEVGMPEERRVRFHHPAMMARADVVIASSPALVERHAAERQDILLVENGVAPATFGESRPVPEAMAGIERPIIGYHGMIARWFDFDMVTAIAAGHPTATVVLVGPHDQDAAERLARLTERPNVRYLGPQPSDRIAAFVQRFDVGLVPFVVDDLTRAVSPLKMYEYLAAGVPVVAAPLPVCEAHPLVTTVGTPGEATTAVASAIERANDPLHVAALRAAAEEASWATRLQPVVDTLDATGRRRVGT